MYIYSSSPPNWDLSQEACVSALVGDASKAGGDMALGENVEHHIYIYMYIYIYEYLHIRIYTYFFIYIYMFNYLYTHIDTYICVHVYIQFCTFKRGPLAGSVRVSAGGGFERGSREYGARGERPASGHRVPLLHARDLRPGPRSPPNLRPLVF